MGDIHQTQTTRSITSESESAPSKTPVPRQNGPDRAFPHGGNAGRDLPPARAEPGGPERAAADRAARAGQQCVCLDHAFFPHILDSILASCGHAERLALRRTSRAVKCIVDRLFAERVVATDAGLHTPAGARIPFLSPHSGPSSAPPPLIRRLDVACEHAPAVEAALARLALDTVHLYAGCAGVACDTLVLHAAHHVELAGPRVRTLVLHIAAPAGYTYFVRRPRIQAENVFVVSQPGADVLLLDGGDATALSRDEWDWLSACRTL